MELNSMSVKAMATQYQSVFRFLYRHASKDVNIMAACNRESITEDGLIQYINKKAMQQIKNEACFIPDKTVFAWALEYVMEGYKPLNKSPEDMIEDFYKAWGVNDGC